jgi:hypothetical protein
MMNNYYVYCHFRNDTNDVFYVGKGFGCRKNKTHGRSKYWNSVVAKANGFKSQEIASNLTEAEALAFEVLMINKLRQDGAKLCNLTDGGDGVSGYRHTAEVCEAQRQRMLGVTPWNKGKQTSQEVKEKLSKAKLGVKQSPEHIEAAAKARIGRKVSEETRRKISEANIGRKLPEEQYAHRLKPVICITTGIKYKSVTEAAKALGLFSSNISRCCMGKFKQTGGFQFKYSEA